MCWRGCYFLHQLYYEAHRGSADQRPIWNTILLEQSKASLNILRASPHLIRKYVIAPNAYYEYNNFSRGKRLANFTVYFSKGV